MSRDQPTGPVTVKRSYKDGCVSIAVKISSSEWGGLAVRVKVDGGVDVTTAQARALAQALIEQADYADGKVASKAASEARRKKWRDREIASGRMKTVSVSDFRLSRK